MDEPPQSLHAHFASAKGKKKALETANATDPAYEGQINAAIDAFEACKRLITKLSMFSPNESLEDITTADLQYLTVDFLLADLLQRSYDSDRLKLLHRTRRQYDKFLETLDLYGILSAADKKLYEQYCDNPDSFTLAPANDAGARRQVKVTRFREEKELKQKLEHLASDRRARENDDEVVREVYLSEIQLYVHQTYQALDMLSQELSILSSIRHAEPTRAPQNEPDSRSRNGTDKNPYSERLDVGLARGRGNGPLLNKEGVPMQPFVLTNKKIDLQKGVFRSGHNLPTMSIDEYLEEERARGGIIEGGGEQSGQPEQIDEDDFDKADQETMKARAWDEFTEENPKGSGNTLNRG